MAELLKVHVEIMLKKTIPVGSAGRVGRAGLAGWLDKLEIWLDSAQLELELG